MFKKRFTVFSLNSLRIWLNKFLEKFEHFPVQFELQTGQSSLRGSSSSRDSTLSLVSLSSSWRNSRFVLSTSRNETDHHQYNWKNDNKRINTIVYQLALPKFFYLWFPSNVQWLECRNLIYFWFSSITAIKSSILTRYVFLQDFLAADWG